MHTSSRSARRGWHRLMLLALALLALIAASAATAMADTSASTSQARSELTRLSARTSSRSASAAAAKKKKATKKKKAKPKPKPKYCVVHIQLANGKSEQATQTVWVYKDVKKHGKRVRVMRKVKVAVVAGCNPPKCVKQTVIKGKETLVTVKVSELVATPKKGKLVLKRQKVAKYVLVACTTKTPVTPVTTPGGGGGTQSLGTPVTITVNPTSQVNLNFYAFQRTSSIEGTLQGYMLSAGASGGTSQIVLTSGTLVMPPTPVFIDNVCNGQVTPSIETNYTTIALDPTKQSDTTLQANGSIQSVVNTVIKLPLLLRNGDTGCTQPYMTTGYDQESATFYFSGTLTGLTNLRLTSPSEDITFGACLGLGPASQPCNGFEVPIDVGISTDLSVNITLGT